MIQLQVLYIYAIFVAGICINAHTHTLMYEAKQYQIEFCEKKTKKHKKSMKMMMIMIRSLDDNQPKEDAKLGGITTT